jgi:hypothetical protein
LSQYQTKFLRCGSKDSQRSTKDNILHEKHFTNILEKASSFAAQHCLPTHGKTSSAM